MCGRPTFNPVFEETEDAIRSRLVTRISDEWRKEPGDFMYDSVAPAAPEIKQLEANQDAVIKNSFALYAEGDKLDLKLAEIGLSRIQAVASKREIAVTADAGVVIPAGYTVSSIVLDTGGNPVELTADSSITFSSAGTQTLSITCKQAGVIGNLPTGTPFILVPPIPGIKTLSDGGITVLGTDTESDESAWSRYDFKVKHPDTGGNKNDYIRWVEPIDGVGKVKVIPRWAGNGTVKIILVDDNMDPVSPTVVDNVQEFLDPLLAATLEAESMTITGTGASVDASLSYDSGTSIKMVHNVAGCGIKYGFGGVLESLIETENTFLANVVAAVNSVSSSSDLLQITVRDRGTLTALKTVKGGSTAASISVKASDFSTINTLQVFPVQFYWDGVQPIEIIVSRLTSDTTTTVWVDKLEFSSLYGQGLGNGQAPGGARVTVKAADALEINVTATVTYSAGYDPVSVKQVYQAALDAYLQTLVFKEQVTVVYARIGSILINTDGVSNYNTASLLVNGGTADIVIGEEEVPVVGTVSI